MDGILLINALASALAIVVSALASVQAWEHRRYVRGRLATPTARYQPRTIVLAPVKGLEPEHDGNLRPLFEQDYGPFELVFLVESSLDSAFGTVRKLILEYPRVKARLLLTGSAGDCGQKVHNLLVGTAELGDAEVLAFVDSDARPRRHWLSSLTARIGGGFAAATTGYRWYVPAQSTLPNLILHGINAALVPWIGPGRRHFVWGGSWAISREAFERARLREAWAQTLSDDLVASRALEVAGERVAFEPAAMVASTADFDWPGLVSFLRRQLIIARCYARGPWLVLAFMSALLPLVLWGNLAVGLTRCWRASGGAAAPLAVAAALWGLQMLRAYARQDAARRYLSEHAAANRACRWFDILAGPLTGLALAAAFALSSVGRRITWRGIRYRIGPAGRVDIEHRPDPPLQSPKRRAKTNGQRNAA